MYRARFLGTAAALALALGVPASSYAADATVRLEPGGATSVPQGTPMPYRAVLSNSAPTDQAMSLTFSLRSASGGSAVAFREWNGTVPARSQMVVDGDVVPSQWFAALGGYTISTAQSALAFEVTAPPVAVPTFRDVTAETGLTTQHQVDKLCDNFAAGAAWGDVDGDGDLDLYLPHQTAPAQLFVNEGGRFVERAAAAGVDSPGRAMAAVMADYDNDGDQDVYVGVHGRNRLYRNDGAGRFHDVAAAAGVDDDRPSTGAAWGDYDGDGLLDLYVANYAVCGLGDLDDILKDDGLYHNEGDGTFTDRTWLLPGKTDGLGFQVSWLDIDDDGDLDLHLGNDSAPGLPRNEMWRNDGPGAGGTWRFANISDASGTGININTMGAAIGDYDRDGDLDFALSNMGPNVLFRNEGDTTFTNRAVAARVARPDQRAGAMSVTWGMELRDLNNDGWEDLYAVAGEMAEPGTPVPPQPNGVFVNAGNGTFLDLSAATGADDPGQGRGVAVADFDRDGRLDLYLVNQAGPALLFRNTTAGAGHWLEVALQGTVSNRDGCGARAVAELDGGVRLRRDAFCGSTGFASGADPVLHFGLGGAGSVRKLTVTWPSGAVQVLQGVAADRRITLTEPLSPVNARPVARDDAAATAEDTTIDVPVLANDSDPDRDPLRAGLHDRTSARGGSVSCLGAACTYTPAVNFSGLDSFTYTAADGKGGVDVADVTVTVRPVNDPPKAVDDEVTIDEDTPLSLNVLANDTDAEGDPLHLARFDRTSALGGSVTCHMDGGCTYMPPRNVNGADSFTYDAADASGASDGATVRISIRPVNDAPMAADDSATTVEYRPVEIRVLENDADPDGDALRVDMVSYPMHGTAFAGADGVITYTPDAAFEGEDAFEYTVADGRGGYAVATIRVMVDGCGEDGPASGVIDSQLEPLLAMLGSDLAALLNDVNCSLVVPAENVVP